MRRGFIPDKTEANKIGQQASLGKSGGQSAGNQAANKAGRDQNNLNNSGGVDNLAAMADDINNLNELYQEAAPQMAKRGSQKQKSLKKGSFDSQKGGSGVLRQPGDKGLNDLPVGTDPNQSMMNDTEGELLGSAVKNFPVAIDDEEAGPASQMALRQAVQSKPMGGVNTQKPQKSKSKLIEGQAKNRPPTGSQKSGKRGQSESQSDADSMLSGSAGGHNRIQALEQDEIDRAQEEAQRQRHDSHGTSSSDDQQSGSQETSSDDSDNFSSEGSSEKSVAFSDATSESLSDEEAKVAPLRVYDARFKIPAHNTLGELMKAKGKDSKKHGNEIQRKKKLQETVKTVEGYKRLVRALSQLFMLLSMIFTWALYAYNIFLLNQGEWQVGRTRQEVTQVIDFEEITTKEVAYFLHRNSRLDPDLEIVANVSEACNKGGFELIKDRNRITQIRDTIESYFMVFSQSYILVLMFILAILAVYAIPVKLREHHIPMLFRQADENMFSVIMRAMIFAYFYFIILCGCMPSVSMYRTNDMCLHTGAEKSWGSVAEHEFNQRISDGKSSFNQFLNAQI